MIRPGRSFSIYNVHIGPRFFHAESSTGGHGVAVVFFLKMSEQGEAVLLDISAAEAGTETIT